MKVMEECSNRGRSMISGFLAGTASPVCTGPFDVVKTRLMAQSRSGDGLKYRGMFHAISTIYALQRKESGDARTGRSFGTKYNNHQGLGARFDNQEQSRSPGAKLDDHRSLGIRSDN
ncbi:hypothetical protein RJ640_001582 [Escallonia rubra]|uniref:Uncharacterized protein n=1 Tax=Escallonia rubra TaxID=112253 RepID=A0AA88RN37_9ASTE|nr:hypothetical protein RJ640_001582 [Escallonia rubra]